MSTVGHPGPGRAGPRTGSPWARRVVVPRTGSTNDDLRAALSGPDGLLDPASGPCWPHLSVLRAAEQTSGRGRAEHTWVTPPAGALTASVVLRPLVPAERLGWLPLLAGLAVCQALSPLLAGSGWSLRTKWPNDVVAVPAQSGPAAAGQGPAAPPAKATQQVEDLPGWGRSRKLAGVLTELVSPRGGLSPLAPADREAAGAVVVGIGVNLGQQASGLPVPWAASLSSLGAAPAAVLPQAGEAGLLPAPADGGPAAGWDADLVLDLVGHHLADLLRRWEAAQGDPDAPGCPLGAAVRQGCSTLGQWCQAQVPGLQDPVEGLAVGLEPGLVLRDPAGSLRVLAVAEVTSVRHPGVIWDTLAQ
ncbi:biotin--[acetyl-CoA-carboxylase] ligase [Actinomyces weissii]|uniref:BPL/LPL catalytic domain-containing protein n=1 Tax=Actinomyces weissii TaxID=675090 RepID=A0A7T7M9T8_9ACTO|nr:hypothetical protein [Actinomyces weissii]QQM67022.1 hypothetical protein JG540_08225 [Actinomyces weissii]